MKLRKTYSYEVELSKEEFIEIAKMHNRKHYYAPEYMYDMEEVELTIEDDIIITDTTIDDYMDSEDFWMLFAIYTDWPNDTDCFEKEVIIPVPKPLS